MKISFRSALKDLTALLAVFFAAFIFFGAFLVYFESGTFGFHWGTLKQILSENIQYLLLMIVAMLVTIFVIVNYFMWVLSQRRNCQIQYVELSQIAMTWLEYNEVENNIRDKVESSIDESAKQAVSFDSIGKDISIRLLDINSSIIRDFVKTHIIPFSAQFDEYEMKIIFDILEMLDTNGNISSVASLYPKDPEKQTYGDKAITLDGKTSYDVLAEFTLLDHTIRVAKVITTLNNDDSERLNTGTMYSRIIISALAHDIGKIKVKENTIRITGEMYHKTPHEHISTMMFQEMYPDYKYVKTITDSIRGHHLYKVDGTVAKLLRDADKKAREIEIGDWLIRNKETTLIQQAEPTHALIKSDDTNTVSIEQKPLVAEKKEQTSPKKQPIKLPVQSKQNDILEYDFMAAHGEELIRCLFDIINTVEVSKLTHSEKIISISFGDVVLYDYMIIKKIFESITATRLDKKALESIFKQLKDVGVIKLINTDDGFLVSKFILETPSGKEEVNFVPVSCHLFGLTDEEIEEKKRSHPKLRSVNVQTYNNSINQSKG